MSLAATLFSLWMATCIGIVLPGLVDITTERGSSQEQAPLPKQMHCPSWCDPNGTFHVSVFCLTPPFCCNNGGTLGCCYDQSRKINESVIQDNHNCEAYAAPWTNRYWKMILGLCLPLGMISFVGSLSLCGYLAVRDRRRRQHQRRRRSVSESSRSSSRSSTSSGLNVPGDLGVNDLGVANGGCDCHAGADDNVDDIFTVNLSRRLPPPYIFALTPPPYTEEEPPEYEDIFCETAGSSYPA